MSIKNNYPIIRPSLDLNFAGSKTVDPRVTFTRASTATYYDGKTVAKAEENLLTYSQDFDNAAWTKTRLSVTANTAIAPDGTLTADSLEQQTGQNSAGSVSIAYTTVAGTYIISVFAKQNSKGFLVLGEALQGASIARTWFNLSTGVVGTTAGGHTATIAAASNGYYRCTITVTALARSATVLIGISDTDNSTTITDSGGIYVWGAQFEQRSQITAYTPTTSQPITNYIPVLQTAAANVARFDHNPTTGESLGLLIEEQRTNLLTWSQEFDNAAWVKQASSVTQNAATAPDGTLTADKIIADSTNSRHIAYYLYAFSAQSYNYSIYVKSGGKQYISVSAVGSGAYAIVDLAAGSIIRTAGLNSYYIQNAGNGWYRVSISWTSLAAGNAVYVEILGSTLVQAWVGNGYSGIYIWGAQLEAGAFPTSYIPTASAQVTRAADNAEMTGANFSSWYRQDEGAIVVVADRASQTSVAAVGDGTFQNSLAFANQNLVRGEGGGYSPTISLGNLTAGPVKVAVALKDYDIAAAISGAAPLTNTSNKLLTMSKLNIGQQYDGAGGSVSIKRLTYYPKRLPNTQLQALTL